MQIHTNSTYEDIHHATRSYFTTFTFFISERNELFYSDKQSLFVENQFSMISHYIMIFIFINDKIT